MSDKKVTRRRFLRGLAATAGGTVLAACTPRVVEKVVDRPVIQTVVVEKAVEVEKVATVIVEKAVEIEKQVVQTVVVEKIVDRPVEKIVKEVVKETVIVEGTPVVKEKIVEKVITTAPPAAEPPTPLRVSHWWPSDWTDTWRYINEEKTNTIITEEITPFGDYLTKVQTQLAAGEGPDIIQMGTNHNGSFFPKGVIAPLDDALEASGVDMSKWGIDPRIEVGYKGKIMGLELFVLSAMMGFINMDLVEKAGYPADQIPLWATTRFDTWTWDDFVEFLKAVTIKNADGTYEQYGIESTFAGALMMQFALGTRGSALLDDPWAFEEMELFPDMDKAIAAAHDLLDLTLVHEVGPTLEAAQGIQGGLFRAGLGVVRIQWGNTILLRANLPFKMQFIQLPWVERRVHPLGANHWCVNNSSKYVPKAMEATIVQATDFEIGKKFFEATAIIPSYDPGEFLGFVGEGDSGTVTRISFSRMKGLSECAYCSQDVDLFLSNHLGRTGNFLGQTVAAEMQKALIREKTIEEALADAKRIVDAELKATPM